MRGGIEHHDLNLSQLHCEVVVMKEVSTIRYTYVEHGSKNRSGGLKQLKQDNKVVRQYESNRMERCHVLLLDKYIFKLPQDAKVKDNFYLKPKASTPCDPMAPWFTSVPIGRNSLGQMMKDMARGGHKP